MICAMILSGVVSPVASASAMPRDSVAATAKRPARIGRDFAYAICELIVSITVLSCER